LQIGMVELLQNGFSLEQLVHHYFQNGICVSFTSLRDLLRFLVQEDLLMNEPIRELFTSEAPAPKGWLARCLERLSPPSSEPLDLNAALADLPFFRTLKPQVFEAFSAAARVLSVGGRALICRSGARQRNLYVLLKGEASVRKPGAGERLAVLRQGAVFGEAGFFLGEPRSAAVVTECPSLIAQIPYEARVFDPLIKKDHARDLQRRFWVIHALLKSELFRDIPSDCFDALIFSGEIRTFPARARICRTGEPGQTCYIVVQGELQVEQNGRAIRRLGQGDCFGELALIASGGLRTADVISLGDVVLLEIPAARFYKLLGQNLMLACEFERAALSRIRDDQARPKT
jgi:CRP-like cAMP-binding protein